MSESPGAARPRSTSNQPNSHHANASRDVITGRDVTVTNVYGGPGADTDPIAAGTVPGHSSGMATRPPTRAWTARHSLLDLFAGGGGRRLARAVRRTHQAFSVPAQAAAFDQAARAYRRSVRMALRLDPGQAVRLVRSFDGMIPAAHYAGAFSAVDNAWLAGLSTTLDRNVLTVAIELAARLELLTPARQARDLLADLLGQSRDAGTVVEALERWRTLGILESAQVARVLGGYVTHSHLEEDPLVWGEFLGRLPAAWIPPLPEVYAFLGRGADAVRTARTAAQQRAAIECCARSARLDDLLAGIDLAGGVGIDIPAAMRERAADLLFEQTRYAEALEHYQAVGRRDRSCDCYQRLGRFLEALEVCPADQPDRLAALAGKVQPDVEALAEDGDFLQAIGMVHQLLEHTARAGPRTLAVLARWSEVTNLESRVLLGATRHFRDRCDRSAPNERPAVYREWSQFEEAAGRLLEAALRAEEAGEYFRASRLYYRAHRFGDAERVLRGDNSPEALVARAKACLAGNDGIGAAILYQQAGRWERAIELAMAGGEFGRAGGWLREWLGDEAIHDPRLANCLRRSGQLDQLAGLVLAAAATQPIGWVAAELRRLRTDPELSPRLRRKVRAALDRMYGESQRTFEAKAAGWVAQARRSVDQRFARAWGLDLGTSTSVAAIYDTVQGRPVVCPWNGQEHFASTLSIDRDGNEVVGLPTEQVSGSRVTGHIAAAKRRMGQDDPYKVGTRRYRPEEVAARLIQHARGIVEDFLAGHVRERLAELARAELSIVNDEWLAWAEQQYDIRLSRPRLIVTIPAYFTNNQKHATRDACTIAGVESLRLIHEPTAACLSVARQHGLTGDVIVVDLGAGTLDISLLNVEDGVYEVKAVSGDSTYGGRDFDQVIARHLASKLAADGVQVPGTRLRRLQLEAAAEQLKILLSAQEYAEEVRHGIAPDQPVQLRLSRAELTEILQQPLARLRAVCTEFMRLLGPSAAEVKRSGHLVLVGRPMRSPIVAEAVQDAVWIPRRHVADPHTAVAFGACLQAAVLGRELTDEVLLVDVTPLGLGIQTEGGTFAKLIERTTPIPTRRSDIFTTVADNQRNVDIQIYQGEQAAVAGNEKIGRFALDEIPPAPKGVPQIEVAFEIDASCVLTVTARDLGTGRTRSVRLADSTLLSPAEVTRMTNSYRSQRDRDERRIDQERQRAEAEWARATLRELVAEAAGLTGDAIWRVFSRRLAAYRPAPRGSADAAVAEIFRSAGAMEVDLELAQRPVREVIGWATDQLAADPGDDPAADVARCQHLVHELSGHLEALRPLARTVDGWTDMLADLTAADPVERFREQHAEGRYADAVATLDAAGVSLTEPGDLDRQLHCLAELGRAERYRSVLAHSAARLPERLFEPTGTAATTVPGLVTVTVRPPEGEPAIGSGFTVLDRFVVTSRTLLSRDAAAGTLAEAGQVTIGLAGSGARPARRILVAEQPAEIALIELTEPVGTPPVRLGWPALSRIGDPVWVLVPRPDGGTGDGPQQGVIDSLETTGPERRLSLTGIDPPPGCVGAPVFDEGGEVVAVLAGPAADGAAPACQAVAIDALRPLLTAATAGGHAPVPPGTGSHDDG